MNIKVGDKWSRLSYGEITEINGRTIFLKNEHGYMWSIDKELFIKECNVASSYDMETSVTRTELTQIILKNTGVIMTVNFNKKIDDKLVEQSLNNLVELVETGATVNTKPIAKYILTGTERTIIGRHNHHIDEMGRLQFVDMELEMDSSKDYDVRLRKVDPRTVNWVIVNNVKFKLK